MASSDQKEEGKLMPDSTSANIRSMSTPHGRPSTCNQREGDYLSERIERTRITITKTSTIHQVDQLEGKESTPVSTCFQDVQVADIQTASSSTGKSGKTVHHKQVGMISQKSSGQLTAESTPVVRSDAKDRQVLNSSSKKSIADGEPILHTANKNGSNLTYTSNIAEGKQNMTPQGVSSPVCIRDESGGFPKQCHTAECSEIIEKLGLSQYYPGKISLQQATAIRKFPTKLEPKDLPWKLIHMLIMIDYRSRDTVLSDLKTLGQESNMQTDASELDFGDCDDQESCLALHPMDVLLATFSSCDGILRQVLAHNMFVCKLAIPFFYSVGSPDNVFMSLWALETIIVEWRDKQNNPFEVSVTDQPIPIVTFIRFSKVTLSKSKLINDVLRDETHNTFFNRECQNSSADRKLADGLVECSWFIPGKEVDTFQDVTLLLNLRGDGMANKKLVGTLNKLSSVTIVAVDAQNLAKSSQVEAFLEISKTAKKVIILLTCAPNMSAQSVKADWQEFERQIGKGSLQGIKVILPLKKGSPKSASDLKIEVRQTVSNMLKTNDRSSNTSLAQVALIAQEEGIQPDVLESACMQGKNYAGKVIKHVKGKCAVECKKALLPLQGDTWLTYSTLLKKQNKAGTKADLSLVNKLDEDMAKARKDQSDICKNLSPFFKEFVTYLLSIDSDEVLLYFVRWMKILLDAESRKTLPKLQTKYHEVWGQFQKAKNKQDKDNMTRLQKEVNQAERDLAAASFGLEHVFREIGQLYEAVTESGSEFKGDILTMVNKLPEIVAKCLIRGNPIEIVDGDASNVPMKWIKAVMSKLKHMGDKKLFVISVLGIQSSGKSTLLNTMFGLQFAVSAGRCTRGAYMQVIPVQRRDLPISYVVVVDTEGLRAPELGQLKHNHDNELATLAIGLGDVTLMNIKGENTAEIKDILQIVVHAFMRMKRVNKAVNMHKTCVFIHQNVPAVNAKEKMMHGCQKLQENLDLMTKEAAEGENISDIHTFSQIIRFDIRHNVWYFSDLWRGDPPMAPANPGYSEKVWAVATCLLDDIAKHQTTVLTFSDLCARLSDLWKGILTDDFVFSFRNSLEVKAYNALEKTYFKLEWELETFVNDWMCTHAASELQKCETVTELDKCNTQMHSELHAIIAKKAVETKVSLTKFFENSNLQEIMIQWQENKFIALQMDTERMRQECEKKVSAYKDSQHIEILRRTKWVPKEAALMQKAKELADDLKGKDASESELNAKFDQMWQPLVKKLASDHTTQSEKVDAVVTKILRKAFNSHANILNDELDNHPLEPTNDELDYTPTVLNQSFEVAVTEEDLSVHKSFWTTFGTKINIVKDPFTLAKHQTAMLTDGILGDIDVHLYNLRCQDTQFQECHARDVIMLLKNAIDDFNKHTTEHKFTITSKYEVRLAVHISRHCVRMFNEMQKTYESKHGVEAKLQEYRQTTWKLFQNVVQERTEEVIAADLFCDQLKNVIESTVSQAIPSKVVDKVMTNVGGLKHYLITKMMDDLANKCIFDDYKTYITKPTTYALRWLTRITDDLLFSKKHNQGMSLYGELTKRHIHEIRGCIVKSVESAISEVEHQTQGKTKSWINAFCNKVKIPVSRSTLTHVAGRTVTDFTNLKEMIFEKLEVLVTDLTTEFCNQKADCIKWKGVTPYQQVMDKLWGCTSHCPFCKEPCSNTASNHSNRAHTCVQHRPAGVSGWHGSESGVLNSRICNYSIQHTNTFKCDGDCHECTKNKDTSKKYHPYRAYRKSFPTWDIAPDSTNNASKYWRWFMATFQGELATWHDTKLPEIPSTWHNITKQAAIESLREFDNFKA